MLPWNRRQAFNPLSGTVAAQRVLCQVDASKLLSPLQGAGRSWEDLGLQFWYSPFGRPPFQSQIWKTAHKVNWKDTMQSTFGTVFVSLEVDQKQKGNILASIKLVFSYKKLNVFRKISNKHPFLPSTHRSPRNKKKKKIYFEAHIQGLDPGFCVCVSYEIWILNCNLNLAV